MNDELYAHLNDGLALYRAGKFFEAHEIWEWAWKVEVGRTKLALQSLILIAAALYKHGLGVPAGTSKLLAKAEGVIGEVRVGASAWLGIDFVALAAEVERALLEADRVGRGEGTAVAPPALPAVSGPDGILYLHGFASGPSSAKAQAFREGFLETGLHFAIPDQNEGDFSHFTVSRALALAKRHVRDRTLVIGSSLGGYIGALLQQSDDRIKSLVLIAPAFDFGPRLVKRHGERAVAEWIQKGSLEVEHYALGGMHPIGSALLEDAMHLPSFPAIRAPTAIFHGTRDETVPAEVSEQIQRAHPDRVTLDLVDDVHAMVASSGRALDAARRMAASLTLAPDPAPVEPAQALLRLAELEAGAG